MIKVRKNLNPEKYDLSETKKGKAFQRQGNQKDLNISPDDKKGKHYKSCYKPQNI